MNYGAVSIDYANKHPETLLYELKRHLYTQILVFQKIAYGNPDLPTRDALHPAFKLEKLMELQTSATEYVRISKVILGH
ncbi:MAG: hypothetical protein HW416_3904 [Chloroflexi bacterium]|nr:hypothetical protein [Chloroflexota bacterium]